ncbi:MAG: RodZ domain-containing protein [Thermoanaerobaculia bacterium]
MAAETTREFGEEFRRHRELRDVSREQLAAVTKVSVRQIESLEAGRFELLPAEVFTRGFVRSIALHLGLDPEASVAAFIHVHRNWAAAAELQSKLTSPGSGTHPRLSRPRRSVSSDTTVLGLGIAALLALVTGTAAFVKSRAAERNVQVPSPTVAVAADRAESGPGSLALPPAIAAATVALAPDESPTRPEPLTTSQAMSHTVPVAAAAPVRDSVASSSTQPSPGRPLGARLTLTFRADCWTEVSIGGKVVVAELFRKGTRREFTGVGRFTLTLGDAGAVDVAVDGRSLQAIGRPGERVLNYPVGDQRRPQTTG